MALPLKSQVHVDVPITNMSVAWLQEAVDFVARRMFPSVRSSKSSDKYYEYSREYFNRIQASKLAPGANFPGTGFGIATESFNTEKRGIQHPMPIEVESDADEVLMIKEGQSRWVQQQLLLLEESEFAAEFFGTGIWTTDYDGSGADFIQFDLANSDPVLVFTAARRAIKLLTGVWPNKLLLGQETADVIWSNDAVIARIKNTVPSITGQNLAKADEMSLAQVLKLDEVLVGGAIVNTEAEPGETNSFILDGSGAMMCYAAPVPSRFTPSAGYTFVTDSPKLGTNSDGMVFSDWMDDATETEYRRGKAYYDQKLVSADLGAFFANCVS